MEEERTGLAFALRIELNNLWENAVTLWGLNQLDCSTSPNDEDSNFTGANEELNLDSEIQFWI